MRAINRFLIFTAILIASAVCVSLYMAPSHREIALMRMGDLDFSGAFKNFSSLHEAGDNSINVLAPLVNLNVYYGDIDKSIDLLKVYVAEHKDTVEGRKRLAELYKASQRLNNYCAVLEELQKISPSVDHLRELASTYDFLGRYKDEQKTLEKLIDADDYRPVVDDYIQLAYFYRAEKEGDKASDLLHDYITEHKYDVKAEVVFLAVSLDLEQDEKSSARTLATRYLKKHDREIDAVTLSSTFEAYGQFDTAYDLLTPYLDTIDQSPELEKQVISLLLAQQKVDEAYKLLRDQYARHAMPPQMTASLIDLAVTHQDFELIAQILGQADMATLSEDSLLRYAAMTLQMKKPEIAQVIHDKLGSDLKNAPLLNAVLNLGMRDTPENFNALMALPEDRIVSRVSRTIAASIYLSHGQGRKAFGLLKPVPVRDLLEILDENELASMYLDTGMANEGMALLAQARETSKDRFVPLIDRALLLINVGLDKRDVVREAFKKDGLEKDTAFISDALDIATRFHRSALAAEFSERIYKIAPTTRNRLQLAVALLEAERFNEALQYLQLPAEKDLASRTAYLDAIDDLIERAGISRLPDAQKYQFQSVLMQAVENPALTKTEKLRFAYLLEEIGLTDEAESIFVETAADQPYDSSAVTELLGFWEDHPSDVARDWIEARARNTSASQRIGWLTALNDLNYPQSVINLLRNDWYSSPAAADQYITALVALHDSTKLNEAFNHAIATESNPVRLKQLAQLADGEDILGASQTAWRKLHQISPNDQDAALQLGMIDYENGRHEEAAPMLKQYLQHNPGTYQINYAYGEILQQSDNASEAKPYFEHALAQLSDLQDKTADMSVTEGTLLFYTGKTQRAMALFRDLIAKNPNDKHIRAEYAELLMKTGHYEEASKLLTQ